MNVQVVVVEVVVLLLMRRWCRLFWLQLFRNCFPTRFRRLVRLTCYLLKMISTRSYLRALPQCTMALHYGTVSLDYAGGREPLAVTIQLHAAAATDYHPASRNYRRRHLSASFMLKVSVTANSQ